MNSGLIGPQGFWVNAESLTETQKVYLISILDDERCPLDQSQMRDFVGGIAFDVRMFRSSIGAMIAPSEKIEQINAVLRAARELQKAISKLSIDARLSLGDCAEEILVEKSDDESPDFSAARDFVRWEGFDVRLDAVIDVCNRAANETDVSKQNKVSISRTKGLASSVARRYLNLNGSKPPYSKNCWFYIFMNELCSMISPGMKCGEVLLRESIGSL